MKTIEAIHARRSIRNYQEKSIPDELVKKLLAAAMAAPSARNQQPWEFIIITERHLLNKIPFVNPNAEMAAHAPLAILVCGNMELETSPGYWVIDCAAAIQNILLCAHAIGLGAVWTGIFPRKERMDGFAELLNLPGHVHPHSLIVVGYPKQQPPSEDRFKEERIHFNGHQSRYPEKIQNNTILYPHGELTGIDVMIDILKDTHRRLLRDLEEIHDKCLHWQVDPSTNSIAVILWHMGRLLDVFFTRQALGRLVENEVWFSGGWAETTGYDPSGIGRDGWGTLNEYTPNEISSIPRFTKQLLILYIDQVYENVIDYLQSTKISDLTKPCMGFNGAYTKYQVITMAVMDNIRHKGEIRLIKSLWERKKPLLMIETDHH